MQYSDNIVAVSVQTLLAQPIVVCCSYSPSNSTLESHFDYFKHLTELANGKDPIMILDDFNLPDTNWATITSASAALAAFHNLIFGLNLTQLVLPPTQSHSIIFDLVITNSVRFISQLMIHSTTSGHRPPYSLI